MPAQSGPKPREPPKDHFSGIINMRISSIAGKIGEYFGQEDLRGS
jgi:hypothetical protein